MSLQVGYLRPELQGCSPLASQQLIVTTWKFFLLETGELSIMQISFCNFMLYPPHVHMPPSTPSSPQIQALHRHSHHGRPGMPGGHPERSVLCFYVWFFLSLFFPSEVFRGVLVECCVWCSFPCFVVLVLSVTYSRCCCPTIPNLSIYMRRHIMHAFLEWEVYNTIDSEREKFIVTDKDSNWAINLHEFWLYNMVPLYRATVWDTMSIEELHHTPPSLLLTHQPWQKLLIGHLC